MATYVDPVCKKEIDEKETEFKRHYKGTSFCFCSGQCLEEFDRDPAEYYVEHSSPG